MSKYPEADKALTKAKVTMMCLPNTVFISTILFNLKQIWDEKIQTAATNGIYLKINPEWFVSLSSEERVGLLAHECWHVAWNHMQRGKHKKNRSKYNQAGDHIINLTLTDAGMEIPPGGLCDTQYRGMSTGEVYTLLPDEPPNSGGGQGDLTQDVVFSDKPDTEDEADQVQIQNTIVKAKIQHEMSGDAAGTIPGDLLRRIEEMLNPILPWRAILQNHMSKFAKADYSFKRPNKRYFPDFYLPAPHSERLDNISVAIDLSGSISDEDLRAFLTECEYIHNTMKPEKMIVLGFDTRITDVHEVTEFQDIRSLKFHGGGGTSLRWFRKFIEKDPPNVMIVFSDMYVSMPKKPKTHTDYIWVIIDNPKEKAPFGLGIHYESDE